MKTGVLLMAYGAAGGLDDIPAYLRDIRGGRPASPELVAEVRERYIRIGGGSPLLDITRRQAAALKARLGEEVYVGMRHAPPTILEAVRRMKEDGCRRAVALPLTPYYSRLSVGAYQEKYKEALEAAEARIDSLMVDSWGDNPFFIEAWAERLGEMLKRMPPADRPSARFVFSAHSLPQRVLEENDPYVRQIEAAISAVAAKAGINAWDFAFQSKGRTPEPWLGPDVAEVIDRLAAEGARTVALVPIGFISDHMETLYDDDVLYKGLAESKGLRFLRAPSLNADPLLIEALADVVRRRLARNP